MSSLTLGQRAPLGANDAAQQLRRAVIAATVGTTIEWYDFFLYSIVTGLVFAKLYFPKSEPLTGTLEAFAIYAVGFIPADRRRDLRPLRRPYRPQVDPHRHAYADGRRHVCRGLRADL